MARAQGIVHPLTGAALFLVMTLREGGEAAVRDTLQDLQGIRRSVGFRTPGGQLDVVVGVGSDAWDRLYSGPRPAKLTPFDPPAGERHAAPATPGDLLFHVRSDSMGVCFELGQQILARLAGAVDVVDETHGFRFYEQRDLLGFVDGTENPEAEDAVRAAIIDDADPFVAGGSYVMVQKYLHDMDAWNALSTGEQERVIGRSKLDDIEMPDAVKPANSHVALNDLDDAPDGTPREILRANMPFGELGAGEFGTYYIAYAADPDITMEMLRNMFVGNPPGNYDRILDFSNAVTGTTFFCPSIDFLESPPPAPHLAGDDDLPAPTPSAPVDASGSLGIGALGRNHR
ncbi:MAG TPA: Dyp-type peroxidase [Propioniciclava sp.]|uniref:Dyp-type peroxidase n=1 Tax=Propioniciclava sp. TaxID=2038686 RepID=UPI002C990A22|nr:Dyp-type peroxidase [Propioniciclava sp.]HRL50463.1 Dyp-type peroxidase [Propioniciclava sp.]HRL80886.1 Dyp-type peroxidase [Propioniciclava sp.]